MTYDFDTPVNRRGSDCVKWDVGPQELPMWIADMDFPAAPEIREALEARVRHGVFGYTDVTKAWYEAYQGWWAQRHHFQMEKDWLLFCTGVVPAISSVVRKLTTPNENVVVQTPVYNIFFNSIVNNGCRILESPLIYKDGAYSMDLEDLEAKLSDPQTSLMILCNPHNPIGKIWDRETLAQVGDLCKKHHVTVLSDEIHCDLTEPGTEYIPFASVNQVCREISVTCLAPTKTFNLAGLQTAAISVPNPVLRHKVWRAINTDEVAEPNVFAVPAAVAAFTRGGPWLDALRAYISANRKRVTEFLEARLPQVKAVPQNATYLMWLDVSSLPGDSEKIAAHLRQSTGLFLTAGSVYGTSGAHFLRLNIACPRTTLENGLARLETGIRSYS